MARGPRDDAPGVAHHVMVRGIERRSIFRDDADREELLRRLSRLAPELGFRCFAWALMPNHFHLVVRSGAARISRLMARLGTGYARYFNCRHARAGHLFQNRFRSRRVTDDADLVGLVVYVSRNPLEARLVADPLALETFPWCGVGALVGRRPPHPFEAVSETLALFDARPACAEQSVRSWLGAPDELEGRAARLDEMPLSVAPLRTPGPSIDELLRRTCARFGVSEEDLRSGQRGARLASARAELASRAASQLGCSGAQIARMLGITRAGVSRMLIRERRCSQASELTS